MNDEHVKLLNLANDKLGKEFQVMLALEEMAELAKELIKNINRKENNIQKIIEEIGDVCILLEQLKIVYNISEQELSNVVDKKMERLRSRIGK